jgi:hypothetical protein
MTSARHETTGYAGSGLGFSAPRGLREVLNAKLEENL